MFLLRRRQGQVCVMRTTGFSLLEIIIAVAIMALMMTAGFLGIRRYVDNAKRLKTETALVASKALIQEYNDHTGAYPATFQDLVTRPTDQKIAARWRGPYADEKELIKGCFVDGWTHDLQYQVVQGARGTDRPFQLYSWGPHGEGAPQEEWLDAWNY